MDKLKEDLRNGEYVDGNRVLHVIERLERELADARAGIRAPLTGAPYRATIGEDGEYVLRRADGIEIGELKFYQDADRIVRACAAVLDVRQVVLIRQATDQTVCVSLATPMAAALFQSQLTRLATEQD